MDCYKTAQGKFIAKTEYGEWQAKQAGFQWDKLDKVWWTTDVKKAMALTTMTGKIFVPMSFMPKPEPKHPAVQGPVDLWPTVLEGRYAIKDATTREFKFYRVDKPKEGKWAGYTFLKVMASDNTYPIKDHATKKAILDKIAENVHGALAQYGQQIGKCGICALTLTDPESIKLGIGPICRKNIGYKVTP